MLALVASGETVFPAGTSFPAHYGHPGVVFVPLHGWPPATRTLLWRSRANSAPVRAFIDVAAAGPAATRERLGNPGYGDWPGPRTIDVAPPE